jgi:hypothetical protein
LNPEAAEKLYAMFSSPIGTRAENRIVKVRNQK